MIRNISWQRILHRGFLAGMLLAILLGTSCSDALIFFDPEVSYQLMYYDGDVVVYSLNAEANPDSSSALATSKDVKITYTLGVNDINDQGQASGYGFSRNFLTEYADYAEGFCSIETVDMYSMVFYLAINRQVNFWDALSINGSLDLRLISRGWEQEYRIDILLESGLP
jgi:hypothetical protein